MKLPGRILRLNHRGEDVKRLQTALRQLGFSVVDPEGFFGSTTFPAVQEFQKTHGLSSTGVVDSETARLIDDTLSARPQEAYIVKGEVVDADSIPVVGATVRAFEKRLKGETRLGQKATDSAGRYEIAFPAPRQPVFSLIVRTFRQGKEIAASPVICKVQPTETVNLTVGNEPARGLSEFVRLDQVVAPILETEKVPAAKLTEDGVRLLACQHDLSAEHLEYYVASARLHETTDISQEVLYGLLRQRQPPELTALLGQPPEVLRSALQVSVRDNIVSRAMQRTIPDLDKALQQQVVRLALRKPDPDRPTFTTMFEIARVNRKHHERILADYASHKGSAEEFWEKLSSAPGIPRREQEELQHTLKLGVITLNHVGLIQELMARRRDGRIGRELRDLSRLTNADWKNLLKSGRGVNKIGAPAFFGKGSKGVERYAEFLSKMVEVIFPTSVLVSRLEGRRGGNLDFSPALTFLRRHPEFELRETSVDAFLKKNPNALSGIQDRPAAVAMLKGIQRLFDITPAFEKAHAISTLLSRGLDSAVAIRRMGPTQFVRLNSEPLGGSAQAQEVYSKAARKADAALLLFSQSIAFNPTWTAVIKPQLFGPGVPDLKDLFGSLDLCQCEHCNSVYSPAAYFVEILHFLMNRPGDEPGRSALDVLFDRRSDLGDIELTCDNTNTVLPYVDLVNEILEHAVAPGGDFPFQTEGSAAALSANPEHINVQAYDTLASARYPMTLPFNLFAEEARTYLNHIGIPRHALMSHFEEDEQTQSAIDQAAEYLGLTQEEREIVTGAAGTPRQFWGFTSQSAFNSFRSTHRVSQVLDRTGLSYDDLTALLETRFVDPGDSLRIRFAGADCNLGTATITSLSNAALDRMHRFLRLQRKLPWSTAELDFILRTLDTDELSDSTLLQIASIKRLTATLGTSLPIVMSWWSPHLDTEGIGDNPSLYEQVFRDPTVHTAPDLAIFALNAATPSNELANPDDSIAEHNAVVHGALRISSSDLELLIDAALPDGQLNLANLTRLYQTVSFARALGLSIRQFLSTRALTGLDPFGPGQIAVTEHFVDQTRNIRGSGFTVEQLDFLLRDQRGEGPQIGADDAALVAVLATLRDELRRIPRAHQLVPDPDGSQTTKYLSLLLPEETIRRAMQIIDGTSTLDEAGKEAFIEEHFAAFMDPDQAKEVLVDPGLMTEDGEPDIERRIEAVLGSLLGHFEQIAMERFVVQTVATSVGVELQVSEQLLRKLVSSSGGNGTSLSVFLAGDFIPAPGTESLPTPTKESFPEQFGTLRRLFKTAMVLDAFAVPAADLDFFFTQGPLLGWLGPNDLLLEPTESGAPLFDAWAKTDRVFRSAKKTLGGLSSLFALLAILKAPEASEDAFLADLSQRTGWSSSDITFLTASAGFDLEFPAGFRDGLFLVRFESVFADLKLLGVAASEARLWAEPSVSAASARAIKQAASSKYTDRQQWASIAKPLRDQLRERQRTALVTFLVHQLELHGPSDLYAHFLIDVEMDPCMLTSRIVLATSAVQLFVQRCLLNLEKVELSPKDAEEWAWMKSYRVWEATRKIFLYPENWILPELRDDKTPFFRQLETGLLQDEINDPSVTREYRSYLTELSRVAQLEIIGLYREWEVDKDILHVFGRTRNTPRVYYYRRWVDQRYWTSWERVDLNIEGSHLVPVVWKGRLYIFWPMFLEKGVENSFNAEEFDEPLHYYELRIAWSEYSNKTWSSPKISDSYISTFPRPVLSSKDRFSFWSYQNAANELLIGFLTIGPVPGFSGASPGDAVRDGWHGPHFKISIGDGEVDLQEAPQFLLVFPEAPPDMTLQFNAFHKAGKSGVELTTSGRTLEAFLAYRYLDPATKTTAAVLGATPSSFKLVVPHAARPFVSQAPFFYQDVTRTFLIVPRGTYVGGVDTGGDLKLKLNAPPLELPDLATGQIAEWMTRGPVDATPAGRSPMTNLASGALITTTEGTPNGDGQPAVLGTRTILQPFPAPAQALVPKYWKAKFFRFDNHYHPYVPLLVEQLNRHGIDGILKPDPEKEPQRSDLLRTLRRQLLTKVFFMSDYEPNKDIVDNVREITHLFELLSAAPLEEFDFSYGGSYSTYNWELFFHAPFLLAKRLSENQRFAEAHRWFHFLFDPIQAPHDPAKEPWPERVWQIRPFFEQGSGRSIQRAMLLLKSSGLSKQERVDRQQLIDQIEAWRKSPFNPHLIARMRPEAYMKAVVMAYLDNLIAWGDYLFRRDTRETINEATQLYVLAAEILGERPLEIRAHEGTKKTINGEELKTFNDLRNRLDAFSNALVELETRLDPMEAGSGGTGGMSGLVGAAGLTFESNRGGNGNGVAVPDLPLAAPHLEPPDDNPPPLDLPLATPIPAVLGPTLFFCIPKNDKLLGYWDTVGDRLFKIRHCMNIEGVVRELPLFEPPIDPGLLVKAAAAGIDISTALSDLNASLPNVRFHLLAQKATELLEAVRSLSAALLSVLEKKDGEALALIRASQETSVLELSEQIRLKQYEEAIEHKNASMRSRQIATTRYTHFERLLGNDQVNVSTIGVPIPLRPTSPNVRFEDVKLEDVEFVAGREVLEAFHDVVGGINTAITQGREAVGEVIGDADASPDEENVDNVDSLRMLRQEKSDLQSSSAAQAYARLAAGGEAISADMHSWPRLSHAFSVSVGAFGSSAGYTLSWTEEDLGSKESANAAFYRGLSVEFSHRAARSSKVGQVVLREHEWTLQSNLAAREVMHIDQQIAAASVRIAVAERELRTHRRRIEDAREIDTFLQSKFTNSDLYSWMMGQTSGVYLQSYQLAYDLAKQAERAFRFELGLDDSSFIQFGYWDSLKKGLEAGEKLRRDLKRLEVAYLEQHRREYEITQHFSLALLNAEALLELRETGSCEFDIPELAFDLAYPGQYMRRIKSASLSVPCITGPFVNVSATLTLLQNRVRVSGSTQQEYAYTGFDDLKFRHDLVGVKSIATSSGQNDSGLFQLNFQDERYLPFEGAGAISRWRLSLPEDFRPFDYGTISDVVLHLSYTARDGGDALRADANEHVSDTINNWLDELAAEGAGLQQLFSLSREFPNELHRLLFPVEGGAQAVDLKISKRHFPYFLRNRALMTTTIAIALRPKEGRSIATTDLVIDINQTAVSGFEPRFAALFVSQSADFVQDVADDAGQWHLRIAEGHLDAESLQDLSLLVTYTVGTS